MTKKNYNHPDNLGKKHAQRVFTEGALGDRLTDMSNTMNNIRPEVKRVPRMLADKPKSAPKDASRFSTAKTKTSRKPAKITKVKSTQVTPGLWKAILNNQASGKERGA